MKTEDKIGALMLIMLGLAVLLCTVKGKGQTVSTLECWEDFQVDQHFQAELQREAPHVKLLKMPTQVVSAKRWRPTNTSVRFFDEASKITITVREIIVIEHQRGEQSSEYTIVTRYEEKIGAAPYTRRVLNMRHLITEAKGNPLTGRSREYRSEMTANVQPDGGEQGPEILNFTIGEITKTFPEIQTIAERLKLVVPPSP